MELMVTTCNNLVSWTHLTKVGASSVFICSYGVLVVCCRLSQQIASS